MTGEDTTTADAHALVEAARSGDAGALEELMRRSRTTVARYAVRLCISPEDAEDAAQEALVAISRHITALRETTALSNWLFLAGGALSLADLSLMPYVGSFAPVQGRAHARRR